MNDIDRKRTLQRELDSAREDVTPLLYTFARYCEQTPTPAPADLAEAAHEMHLKIGRVARFAGLLAREDRS